MKKSDKIELVKQITEQLNETSHFYLVDISGLDASQSSKLRGECFAKDIKLTVVKNTFMDLALKACNKETDEMNDVLIGNTAIMFCEQANAPAKLIKAMAKSLKGKPELKAAYAEECVYVGSEHLEALVSIKSKTELLGDVIGLLQSPIKNLVGSLQSGGSTLQGLLKALEEKAS
ncbi:MAG: 50S ribosomal protein L10 [Bacteroidales bacterium]